jgi:1-carboxybiuret hydrolase subunit AtzG-like
MGKRAKARAAPKAKPRRAAAKKSVRTKAKPAPRDPLDDFIVAAGHALDLPIEPAWQGAIKTNLAVTLRLAALYADFPLPDDAEPAPVFVA